MTEPEQHDADLARLREVVAKLGEHFDCIQIFASKYEDGDTISWHQGLGHWTARYGQVREWVIKQEEGMRCDRRQDFEDNK
jgi:hypothetical protein